MSVTPLQNRDLFRRIEVDAKTSGSLILPDTAKEKAKEGSIVATCAGARGEEGDRIAIDVKESDILGIMA